MKKKKDLNISIFVDESEDKYKIKNNNINCLLLCSLVVVNSKQNKIIRDVAGDVCLNDIPELHFKDMNKANYKKRRYAKKCAKYITTLSNDSIFILISIINKSDLKFMGEGKKRRKNIEKKFTEIAVTKAINQYVRKYNVNVTHICIDKGSKTEDGFFAKNGVKKIQSKTKAKLPKEIQYVDSKISKEKRFKKGAFFIGWSDFILGNYRSFLSMENPTKTKKELVEEMAPYLYLMWRKRSKLGRIVFYPKNKEKMILNKLFTSEKVELYGKYKDPIYSKKIKPKITEGKYEMEKYENKQYSCGKSKI